MKAFIDIETGGFSITKNGVCEIGVVITDKHLNVVSQHRWLIKPYTQEGSSELVNYKPEAMQVHGISVAELYQNGSDVKEVMQDFSRIIKDLQVVTIIGHNSIRFDVPRIEHLLNRFLGTTIKKMFHLDTQDMAKNKYNLPSYSLENLCSHFGIKNEKAHSALGDAYAALELYKKLTNFV